MMGSYGQMQDALSAALVAARPDDNDSDQWIYVRDFTDDTVWYEVNNELLQDGYSSANDEIKLAGKPIQVKAVTTYEPLAASSAHIETRSGRARAQLGGWQERLAVDPGGVADAINARLGLVGRDAMSGELVYTPASGASYYRDLLGRAGRIESPGCEQRLVRHAEQMERVAADRREHALRQLRAGGFEVRVEPNLTDGQGGYFSPPAWLNQLFTTANRPRRVLADLMPRFPLPAGVSQVNLPIITTGTTNEPSAPALQVPDQDITDAAGSSNVVPFAGMADVALQLLELSPPGAHLDFALFTDLNESYDANLEAGLISGVDGPTGSLLGVTHVSGTNSITFTNASPTGSLLYPYLGQAFAQVSNNRYVAPQCWLMRGSRWAWIKTSEDSAGLPFDIGGPNYLGSTDDTPDPVGGIIGLPVFLDEAITNTQGSAGNQDVIIALRPADMILLEGSPQTMVAQDPLSGALGVRIEMHSYVAALTDRRPAGISIVSGSGMSRPSGF